MHTRSSIPRLDVVIVNWNSGVRLERCLAALQAASRDGFTLDRVVIVDNASDPACQPGSYPGLPPIAFVRNTSNFGFAVACGQGASGSRAEYLLFLNPDTCVSKEALSRAVRALDDPARARTAILGLPLVDDRGVPQATCGRFLTVSRIFHQLSGLNLLSPARFEGMRMTEWDHRDTRAVDFVSGACLLVRRPVFERLGGFDPRFVVYLEDVDLALRARRQGWSALFLAGASVYHEGGWGTGRARSLRLSHAWHSLLVYGWKHFSVAGAGAVTCMVFALAPAARVAQALVHGSGRQLGAALSGYGRLWLFVVRDVARRRPQPQPTPAIQAESADDRLPADAI